jgi:hypothetical protein
MAWVLVDVVPLWLHTLVCRAGLGFEEVVVGPLERDGVGRYVDADCVLQLVGFVGWVDGHVVDEPEGRGRAVVFGGRTVVDGEVACSGVVWGENVCRGKAVGVVFIVVCDCRGDWGFCRSICCDDLS